MKDAITKRFEKLKKQKNYVGLTDEVILAKAENQIKEEEFLTNFDLDLVFLDTIEKNQGKTLIKNSDQILKLKAKLGLEKTDKSGKDGYGALELLQKKFEVYREENQGTRHRACPHCGQMILWN